MQVSGGSPAGRRPWKFYAAISLCMLGQLWPILIPFILKSSLLAPARAAVFQLTATVVPNLSALLAAAILRKEGFSFLMETFYHYFAGHAPPEHVGPLRYRIGLILFFTPFLFGWFGLYFESIVPGFTEHRTLFAVAGDLLLLISLFVLGGEFWDKLRSLFSRKARVVLPAKPAGSE